MPSLRDRVIDGGRRMIARVAGDEFVHRMLANGARMSAGSVAGIALGFVQSIIVARILGASGFGELAAIMAAVGIINQLMSWRMADLVVTQVVARMAHGEHRRAGLVVKAAMVSEGVSSFVAAAVCMAVAPLVQDIFTDGADIVTAMRVYSLLLVSNIVTESATGVLRSFNRYGTLSQIFIVTRAVRVVLIAMVAVFDGGLVAVAGAIVVGQLIANVVLVAAALGEAKARFGPHWLGVPLSELSGEARALGRFAIHTNVGSTIGTVVKDSDPLYLGAWHGAQQAGYLSLASSLAGLVSLPIAPLSDTVLREVSHTVARGDVDASRRLIRRGTTLAATWLVPTAIILAIGSWFLIPVVYGSSFEPARWTLLALLPGFVVAQSLFWTRPALYALGRTGTHVRVQVLTLVVKTVLVLAFVYPWGHVADAAVMGAVSALGAVVPATIVWRALRDRAPSVG